MRIFVSSLGCKLNQSEMDSLAGRLIGLGYQIVTSPGEADLCVLNTCAVTHVAAQKSRQALRRLHRENPGARLVATGCYAELDPGDLQDLPGVELVASNQEKERLEALISAPGIRSAPILAAPESLTPHASHVTSHDSGLTFPRTRAFVKIQDGCDNACTYCVIHLARGPQRSRPPDQVVAEVEARLAAGHQEIVLTGVHIGAYGRDGEDGDLGVDLWALVRRLLAETDVPRLRLSSIEPWDLPERAFALWRDPRLCRHLHLPLQSGSDAILRSMARRYTTAEFAALMEAARDAIPGLAVTTDVIVGFPGENEREHARSLDFVQAMSFSRVHVFPFSLRPGTPAAKMRGQVPSQIRAERARAMRAVAAASGLAFRQQAVGRWTDVLWESSRQEGANLVWSGLTDNYLRVYATSEHNLANRLLPTWLDGLFKDGLWGQVRI